MRFAIPFPTLWLALTTIAWAQDADFFSTQVAPILEQHCVGCHLGEEPKGGLDLSTARGVFAGGDSGAAIERGKPDASLLVEYVSGEEPEMPQNADPLSAEQVATLRRWIADGAAWPEGVTLTDQKTIDADWWSLGPLAEAEPPATQGEQASELPPLTVQPVTNEPPPAPGPRNFAPINPVKLAIIWNDLPGLRGLDFIGTVTQLAKRGDDTQMSFALPPLNIACEGLIRFEPSESLTQVGGDWEIECSNRAVISGILVPVAGQAAINGQGVDQDGRSVIFSIQTDG